MNPLTDNNRGMPNWRKRMRSLPVGEKVELIGRFILETRQLEQVKKSCKPLKSVLKLEHTIFPSPQ